DEEQGMMALLAHEGAEASRARVDRFGLFVGLGVSGIARSGAQSFVSKRLARRGDPTIETPARTHATAQPHATRRHDAHPDARRAAHPASSAQLAPACQRSGFSAAIPASWGDELLALAVMRRVGGATDAAFVQCSCPFVAHRLLAGGGDLGPSLLSTVPPPV